VSSDDEDADIKAFSVRLAAAAAVCQVLTPQPQTTPDDTDDSDFEPTPRRLSRSTSSTLPWRQELTSIFAARTKQTARTPQHPPPPLRARAVLAGKESRARGPQSEGGRRRARRFRPGTVALKEIRRHQKTATLLIPKLPFQRLVREIADKVTAGGTQQGGAEFWNARFQSNAIEALQEASEQFITGLLSDAYRITLHAKRVTISPKDIRLVLELRGDTPLSSIGPTSL
jgi:histone H3